MRAAARDWRLYLRAVRILDGEENGIALPILRLLACRRFGPAMAMLAEFEPPPRTLALLREAAAAGDETAKYNLAIELRNRGRLGAYRRALARAARDDADAREELRQFRTRFPHTIMRARRRLSRR